MSPEKRRNKKSFRRKRIYVSAKSQGRLLRRLAGYWLVYHFFVYHAMFLSHGMWSRQAAPFGQRYWEFFVDNYILLACALAGLPMVVWDMLKLSHRIVGPLVRLEGALKRMTQGEAIEEVHLRKNDLIHEFADVFNDFVRQRNRELAAAREAGVVVKPPAEESATTRAEGLELKA